MAVFTIVYKPNSGIVGYVQGAYNARYVVRKLGDQYTFVELLVDEPDNVVNREKEILHECS